MPDIAQPMTAGKELDALVAERVMGMGKHLTRHGTGGICPGVPNYSTDIAAAWLVMERLASLPGVFPWIGEKTGPMGKHVGVWVCNIFRPDEVGSVTEADTAPLAICLTALELF